MANYQELASECLVENASEYWLNVWAIKQSQSVLAGCGQLSEQQCSLLGNILF